MSVGQAELPTSTIGQIQIDLSVDRSAEDDYELLRLANARFLAFVTVPDEVYLHFGSVEAPAIDAREFEGGSLNRPEAIDAGIGAVYVENPAGTGTMTLLAGIDLESNPQPDLGSIDSLDQISSTVSVTDVGDFDINSLPDVTVGTWNAGTLPGLDNQGNLAYGEDTVGTPGTAVQLNGGTSQAVPDGMAVAVQGVVASSGDLVYVGDSSVGSADGYPLTDGQVVTLGVTDVNQIYVDADTGSDGVRWIVEVA